MISAKSPFLIPATPMSISRGDSMGHVLILLATTSRTAPPITNGRPPTFTKSDRRRSPGGTESSARRFRDPTVDLNSLKWDTMFFFETTTFPQPRFKFMFLYYSRQGSSQFPPTRQSQKRLRFDRPTKGWPIQAAFWHEWGAGQGQTGHSLIVVPYICIYMSFRSRLCLSTGELGLTVVPCPATEQQNSKQASHYLER